jgi:hypothetical protein
VSRPQGEARRLLVDLTAEELEAKGGELAHAVREEDDYRAGFEDWQADVKSTKKLKESTLRGLHQTASLLAEVVNLGREERDVPCSWLYALPQGYAFLVRDDSGEMISHRRLDDSERQTDLTEVLREPTPEQLAEWMRGLVVVESDEDDEEP